MAPDPTEFWRVDQTGGFKAKKADPSIMSRNACENIMSSAFKVVGFRGLTEEQDELFQKVNNLSDKELSSFISEASNMAVSYLAQRIYHAFISDEEVKNMINTPFLLQTCSAYLPLYVPMGTETKKGVFTFEHTYIGADGYEELNYCRFSHVTPKPYQHIGRHFYYSHIEPHVLTNYDIPGSSDIPLIHFSEIDFSKDNSKETLGVCKVRTPNGVSKPLMLHNLEKHSFYRSSLNWGFSTIHPNLTRKRTIYEHTASHIKRQVSHYKREPYHQDYILLRRPKPIYRNQAA